MRPQQHAAAPQGLRQETGLTRAPGSCLGPAPLCAPQGQSWLHRLHVRELMRVDVLPSPRHALNTSQVKVQL